MSQWLPRCWNQVAKVTPGIVKKAQEILTKHPKAGAFSLLVLLGPKDMFLCMVFYIFSRIFLAFFTILYYNLRKYGARNVTYLNGRNAKVRAILMECTELPPYSDAVRHICGIPVFDAITACDFYIASHIEHPMMKV